MFQQLFNPQAYNDTAIGKMDYKKFASTMSDQTLPIQQIYSPYQQDQARDSQIQTSMVESNSNYNMSRFQQIPVRSPTGPFDPFNSRNILFRLRFPKAQNNTEYFSRFGIPVPSLNLNLNVTMAPPQYNLTQPNKNDGSACDQSAYSAPAKLTSPQSAQR
jgi:hypothetical protein